MKMKQQVLFLYLVVLGVFTICGCAHIDTPRLRQLDAKIKTDPTDSWEIANRGHVHALLGERRLAYADLTLASRLGGSGDLHSRIGWSYFNLGNNRAALREWQLASDQNKFSTDYDFYTLAVGHWAVKNYQQAMEFYDRLVTSRPPFGKLDALEKRIAGFTIKEKEALRAVYLLWYRAYTERKN
jgi:tetratricopeptide (TPR) repeat protein